MARMDGGCNGQAEPGIVIVDARAAVYAEVLAALHVTAFAEPWDADSLARLTAQPGAVALIASGPAANGQGTGGQADTPLGFIICQQAVEDADIITLAVSPEARRRGVARRLLREAAQRLADSGVTRLILEVAESNLAARALYSASGFTEVGRRRGYYRRPEGREDALVLARSVPINGGG